MFGIKHTIEELYNSETDRHPMYSDGYNDALRHILEYMEGRKMACENCEYHKERAARWRAEAYKQAGKEVELPWVGLTDEEIQSCLNGLPTQSIEVYARRIEAKLKEKNT